MFKYFWTYATDLPPDVGIETFSAVHLTWVTVVIFLVILAILLYRRQTETDRRRSRIIIAILLLGGYLARCIWSAVIGQYSITEMLPLHLCTASIFIESAAVLTGRPVLKEFSYCCSLPGAISAIITPGIGPYPFLSFYYLQFVMEHGLLVLVPLLFIFGEEFRPDIRRLPANTGLLLILAAVAALVNGKIKSNYMFLRFAPKNTPLEAFDAWCGNPGYLVPLAVLVMLIWIVFYFPWIIRALIHKQIHKHGTKPL